MDAASVLEQYVSDLTNLPAEIAYILEEIRDKDLKFYDTRKRIQQRDNQIHKFIRSNGSLADNPKEAAAYPKIRSDFEKAMAIQQSKCDLANTGLYIISRQVKKLNDDIKKLEEEGLLAAASPNGLYSSYNTDSAPSTRQGSIPASGVTGTGRGASRSLASTVAPTAVERKRGSPIPGGSRGSTPAARPSKRQRFAMVVNDSEASLISTPNGAGAEVEVGPGAGKGIGSGAGAGVGVGAGVTVKHSRPQGHHAGSGATTNANNTNTSINGTHAPINGGGTGEEEEVLYCTCQQVSFGNMVACDNPDCQYEWFHYDCVGLKEPPSGTWYCPTCTKERKEARDAGPDFKDTSKRRK